MPDMSHLDAKYFVDPYMYNCPFCRRRHVSYRVVSTASFDWTQSKQCSLYIVRCDSCSKESMHLSYNHMQEIMGYDPGVDRRCFVVPKGADIDDYFFFSQPRSFFSLDERVPKILRDLLWEAEGAQKSNYLTGASAAARKVVYELARLEKADGDDYESRIKSLKLKRPDVDPSYFDTLLTIQQVTSDNVHEESYDGWESKHLRVILAALTEILTEMYVVPQVKEERRKAILLVKEEVLGGKSHDAPQAATPAKPRVGAE